METEPGQALASFIHDAVHGILEDLNWGNTGPGVTPPGADIREEVTAALATEPGQALVSFIHDAFHEILDDLNLGTIGSFIHDGVHEILDLNLGNTGAGVTSSSEFIEPNIGNELALGAFVTIFILDEFDPPSPVVPAEPDVPPDLNPVLDPFGQGLSEFIHSNWPLM